jgi:hypothetical protein
MKKSYDFEAKRDRFLAQVKQIDETLVEYLDALKKQSSEELLSGSSTVAKAYLDEIILLESKTNDLLRLIEKIVDHIDKSGVIEKSKQSTQDSARPSKSVDTEIRRKEAGQTSEPEEIVYAPVKKNEETSRKKVVNSEVQDEEPHEDGFDIDKAILELQEDEAQLTDDRVEVVREKPKKKKKLDTKITILKSLIYLGGIANEEEINKYMQQYSIRTGDQDISVEELRSNLDTMCEKEMISVDPLDDNIEILQNGIDYLAKYEI